MIIRLDYFIITSNSLLSRKNSLLKSFITEQRKHSHIHKRFYYEQILPCLLFLRRKKHKFQTFFYALPLQIQK